MKLIAAAEKLVETLCQSQAQKQNRREFFLSLVPWMRKSCRACGDSHAQKGDLCPTCAKRYLAQ